MWLWAHTGNTRGNLVGLEEIFLHTKRNLPSLQPLCSPFYRGFHSFSPNRISIDNSTYPSLKKKTKTKHFYFEIISDMQKVCKNSEFPYILHPDFQSVNILLV